jgi:hypothetical protein
MPPITHQEKRLLKELNARGVHVASIWDLVNGPTSVYRGTEEILVRHLSLATDEGLIAGLARALTDKAFSSASPILIQQFQSVQSENVRWAIGNAISITGFKGNEAEVLGLIGNPKFGKAREMLVGKAHLIFDPSIERLLIGLLYDPDLDYLAADALSKCGSQTALQALRSMDLTKCSFRTRKGVPKAIQRLLKKLGASKQMVKASHV